MSVHRARRIALALACMVLPHQAAAQNVVPGARVRIMDVKRRSAVLTGRLIRLAGDTITILSASTPTVLIVGARHRLEVSTGTRGSAGRGVGYGLLVGVVVGGVFGATTVDLDTCWPENECRKAGAFGGAVLFSIPGMVMGAIVGANLKHEVWRPDPVHPVRVGIAPAEGRGVRLTASVAF